MTIVEVLLFFQLYFIIRVTIFLVLRVAVAIGIIIIIVIIIIIIIVMIIITVVVNNRCVWMTDTNCEITARSHSTPCKAMFHGGSAFIYSGPAPASRSPGLWESTLS